MSLKIKIRVLNPVSGRVTFIPRRNAEKYVARGRARWHDDRSIAFIMGTYDRNSAERSHALASQAAYDRIGLMTVEQLAGVPVLGDPMKLFTLRKRRT